MKSLLFTAILNLRKRSEQILIKFAILLQVRLTHAQTFFRGVGKPALEFTGPGSFPLSCIITGGPAPILRSVNEVSPKKWRILSENDAISMTTGP